jgi:hypothetical protein
MSEDAVYAVDTEHIVFTPTQAGMVASFYIDKLGRFPEPHEALKYLREEIEEFEEAIDLDVDPEYALKELCDVLYTINGYALSRGWNITRAFDAVHKSNMMKPSAVNGKIPKGDRYIPPDLREFV